MTIHITTPTGRKKELASGDEHKTTLKPGDTVEYQTPKDGSPPFVETVEITATERLVAALIGEEEDFGGRLEIRQRIGKDMEQIFKTVDLPVASHVRVRKQSPPRRTDATT